MVEELSGEESDDDDADGWCQTMMMMPARNTLGRVVVVVV
jgi:hypothetical protein